MTNPNDRLAQLLLVEADDADILLTREAFLRAKINNDLAVAREAGKALRRLRREPPYDHEPRPDLVLLDLALPPSGGQALLETIKKDPQLAGVPVVLLTGSDAEMDLLKSYTVSADGYVVKPVEFDRLWRALASVGSLTLSFIVVAASTFPVSGSS